MFKAWLIVPFLFVSHFSLAHVNLAIEHIEKVTGTKTIYRGGYLKSEADFKRLAEGGVTDIVSLQGGDYSGNPAIVGAIVRRWEAGETPAEIKQQQEWAKKYNIRLINLPVNSLRPLDEINKVHVLQAAWDLNQSELLQDGKVYIHCAHGIDRTGLVIALYRVIYQGWPADRAYAEWRYDGHTLVNMVATWPLDQFFFSYLQRLNVSGFPISVSEDCARNLIF